MNKDKTWFTYLRIALGIIVFGLGIGMFIYSSPETDAIQQAYKWWDWIIYLWNVIWITGSGLFLLDIDY